MSDAANIVPQPLIWSGPGRMSGAVCFHGTRVPVKTLFDHLEAGDPLVEFLVGFPSVTRAHGVAVLELALIEVIASGDRLAAE